MGFLGALGSVCPSQLSICSSCPAHREQRPCAPVPWAWPRGPGRRHCSPLHPGCAGLRGPPRRDPVPATGPVWQRCKVLAGRTSGNKRRGLEVAALGQAPTLMVGAVSVPGASTASGQRAGPRGEGSGLHEGLGQGSAGTPTALAEDLLATSSRRPASRTARCSAMARTHAASATERGAVRRGPPPGRPPATADGYLALQDALAISGQGGSAGPGVSGHVPLLPGL